MKNKQFEPEDPTGIADMWNDEEVNEEMLQKMLKPRKRVVVHQQPVVEEPIKPQQEPIISNQKMLKYNKVQVYKYLNNLDFTEQFINEVKDYLQTDKLPEFTDDRAKRKFIKRFSRDWSILNGYLYFIPLKLVVIPHDEIQERLQEIYDDPVLSLGKGQQAFYDTVKANYLGISRQMATTFLKKQEIYQMTFQKKRVAQKPIYGLYPNEKWGCDLIDMNQYTSHNNNYRYILTVIDYFSRKVFAVALKTKDLESSIDGFKTIVSTQSFNTYPQILICDNGSEFELKDWCKSHKIKLLHTESHSPTQNSLIENFNGSLRRLIRANFVRNNNLNWIDELSILLTNYNSKKHKTTGYVPNDIWREEKGKVKLIDETDNLDETKEQKISNLSKKTTSRAQSQIEQLQKQTLSVGDTVRVSTRSLNSEVRRLVKAGNQKLVVVKFSAKVFKVDKVIQSKQSKEFALSKYVLKDKKGKVLLEEYNAKYPNKILKPRRFNITDLLKIDPNTVNIKTKKDEEYLNKIQNVEIEEVEPVVKPRKSERVKKLTANEKRKQTIELNKVEKEPTRKSGRDKKKNDFLDL